MDTKVTFRIDERLKEELQHMAICQHTRLRPLTWCICSPR